MSFLAHVKRTFSLDVRSLAFYRVCLGLVVLADLFLRLQDIKNLYTDTGLIPRSLFFNEMGMPWSFSFHFANGSYGFAVFMFSIHILLGFMLLVGFKTRWVTLGLYVMAVSLHNRNWLVNNGGNDILRAILFYSVFLPLNRCFSVDSALRTEKDPEKDFFSTWSLAFFLQVFLIYFVSYILKDHAIWRTDFTAMFFSVRLDIFATPLAVWLRGYPSMLKVGTFFSIILEWLGPIVLLLTFVFGKHWWKVRLGLVGLFILFHLGIFLTMTIGVFPFICVAMWMAFIPGAAWDALIGRYRNRGLGTLKIYYDADCGFCLKSVKLLREFFLLPEVSILPAQETAEATKIMKSQNSWVVQNAKGESFSRYEAFLELSRHSPILKFFRGILTTKVVRFLGEKTYHWVSNHRAFMGLFTQHLEYSTPKKRWPLVRFLLEAFGVFIMITIFMWNLTTIKKLHIRSPFFQTVTRWLHLYQEWNMFAPFPKTDNVWVEIPAVLSDGSEMELISGSRDIFSVKSDDFPDNIPSELWRKFYLNLSDRTDYARYYGGFLCRLWNHRKEGLVKGTTLRKMEIIVYSQLNLPNGEKGGIIRKSSWKHWCFNEDYEKENPKASL
jgi:predicted DCC family thiol-disulfide oxidoreductase YuxK